MKARFIMLLCACSLANAESLPLVDDPMVLAANQMTAATPPSPNVLYEMMARLEQLQAEVQQLTGKVEEQANLIAELKQSQTTLYADFDERMQALEKKTEGVKSAAPTAADAVQAPAVDGEAAAVAPESAPAQAAAPSQSEASAAPVGDEKQQYQQAYEALRNGHNSQAIAQFNALLTKNPKSEYAHNAQYWLGEAYRVNQDVDLARQAFNAVVINYPDSLKVPDALLKLGYIEDEQKNIVKAREYFTRVSKEFPNSPAAQRADKKLLSLDEAKQ
ncbi:MAG: tol-pal system protein YbgF [Methylobacter sp.]|jgi:tol-pal system protein YbgF|nr:tol-pal system protein YbgF [Methylobacter sp.]